MEAVTETKKEKVVTKVTMTDGRVVEFAGNKKMLKSYETSNGTVTARFDFVNGQVREMICPPELVPQAAGHGIVQKVGDSVAVEKDVDDMVLGVEATIKSIEAGDWTKQREGGGFSGASIILQALMERYGKPADFIKNHLDKTLADFEAKGQKTTRQQLYASFKADPRIKSIVDRLESEKAAKAPKLDLSAQMAALEAAA